MENGKISKREAKYTESPKPSDGRCVNCEMFRSRGKGAWSGSCTLVQGHILQGAHCRYFKAK